MFGASTQLAQVRPSSTGLVTVLSAPTNAPQIEITRIVVTSVGSGNAHFSLCHVFSSSGSPTFSEDNALFWDKSVTHNDTFIWEADAPGTGIPLGKTGHIGFATDSANGLTLTLYGATVMVQERTVIGEE